jgi:polar amino acid transport system permease protein
MRSACASSNFAVLLTPRQQAQPTEWGVANAALWIRSPQLVALVAIPLAAWATAAVAQGPVTRPGVLELVLKWTPLIWSGFLFNLFVSVATMVLGTLCGIVLGLGQVSILRGIRAASWGVTQFFRNAPWLVLLFFTMFLLPFEFRLGGLVIPFPAWLKAIVGLSLPVMANVSEIVRGGILSIPRGQWDSAESLAFSRTRTLWRIILPQAIKRMIPPWMNLYAILTMATTLISVVGIQDAMTLTRAALVAEARTELFLPLYFTLLLMFFAYCYPIARLTQALERRFAVNA